MVPIKAPTLPYFIGVCVHEKFFNKIYITLPVSPSTPPTLFLIKCGILHMDPYTGINSMFCVSRQNNIWFWLSLSCV